jgi:hypothetical protein
MAAHLISMRGDETVQLLGPSSCGNHPITVSQYYGGQGQPQTA